VRIVQLVEDLELGGLERLAVDLALAQKQAGHEVLVYCLFHAGPLAAGLEAAGIPVAPFHKAPGFSLSTVLAIAKRLRADHVDAIHGHNPGVHHFAALAARLGGVPVCISTRHSVSTSKGLPYQERYFRWVKPLTSHVVFVCDFVRRGLENKLGYPPEKCSVILNGIPLTEFLAHPASPGSRRPRIRFGAIGRLVPAKGHAVLIDAFTRVCRAAPEAELSIYGYGALRDELSAQIASLGLAGKVRLEGRTENSAATLQHLDVFVLSSVNEGLPLVILEAMAAGLPIVSTGVGGIPEVLPKESAWLCPPADAGALADAMLQAVACKDLRERGEAARRLAAASYGLEHMAARYEDLYRRLLPKVISRTE
jgi:glycosyltransferase involved in cell wall biosynthesis